VLTRAAGTVINEYPSFLGSNIALVKAHNIRAILLSLLYEGGLSRVQLAKKTSLSSTTITNLISELLEQKIVAEEDEAEVNGPRSVGRPQTALRLVPDARYAVGVHMDVGVYRVAITNLYAEIILSEIETYPPNTSPEIVLKDISLLVNKVILESGVDLDLILGIGVGASGLVNFREGTNVLAPALGWRDVPIRSILERHLGLPVVVDNNVRAMALGEAMFGSGRNAHSLAFVYSRIGVGAGFVVDNKVFRGSGAGAGEIGHMIIMAEGGELCRCGKRGCLETLVSETGLVTEAEQQAQNSSGLLAAFLSDTSIANPTERIFAAARAGDPVTRSMIEKRACYIGLALANLVNIFNPELILLGGIFTQIEELILPTITATVRENAFAGLGDKVQIRSTSFGWGAGVIGASALALSSFFYQPLEEN
jgi:glucokinase-like ROK family protein